MAKTNDIRVRLSPIAPSTLDESSHSVEAVLATENPCMSLDMKTRKSYLEVYLMPGGIWEKQVPLIDTHVRDSIDRVKGSVRDIRVEGNQLVGRLYISASEFGAWDKVSSKHITDVSFGVQPLETTEIPAGTAREVLGVTYTAPGDQALYVHTAWRLREVSLTPIGADQNAKIRTVGETKMKKFIREWLIANMKLRANASEDKAQVLWDSLSTKDRTRAEEACKDREDDEEDDDKEEDKKVKTARSEEEDDKENGSAKDRESDEAEEKDREDEDEPDGDEKEPEKSKMHRVTRKSVVTEETRSAAIHDERSRVRSIRRAAGKDVPDEIVTRAINEGWTTGRFKGVALNIIREGRARSVGGGGNVDERAREFSSHFGIHTRSHDTDCTAAALGAALFTRSYSGARDPVDVIGGYTRSAEGGDMVVRADVQRMIEGRSKTASEDRRKAAERLLDMGDRYRSISMLEMCDEANRIEGRERGTFDPAERIRAAMSGSALAAIFTTNISAMFLGGYLDAEDTSMGWSTESDVPNFLMNERAIFGKMGNLKKLGRGGTAEDLDTSDWNEQYRISRYAGKFIVDEQDIINDRFGAIEQMAPQDMGLTARQIRPNLLYSLLLSNPVLNQDNTALFHADHGNIVAGAITDFSATVPTANAGPLQNATTAMGKQRLRNRVLNLRPRFVLAGTDLEWALNILYKSQQRVIASGSGGTYNPLAAEGSNVEVKLDGRLDPLGCYNPDDAKTYYACTTTGATTGRAGGCMMVARPGEGGAKTAEVGYLRGTGRAPRIRSGVLPQGMGQYGFAWDVNMDIGAKILDYRGFVQLTGGGTQLAATGP